jgi:hypothetical protein
MIIIGIILLLTSGFLGYSRIKFLDNSVKTEGVVVRYVEAGTVTSSSTSARITRMTYAPVVSFNSSDGKTFEFRSAISSNNKPYSIGDKVKVAYLKENPSVAEIYSFIRMWLLSLGVLFGGIVVLLIGIIGLKHPERITTYG